MILLWDLRFLFRTSKGLSLKKNFFLTNSYWTPSHVPGPRCGHRGGQTIPECRRHGWHRCARGPRRAVTSMREARGMCWPERKLSRRERTEWGKTLNLIPHASAKSGRRTTWKMRLLKRGMEIWTRKRSGGHSGRALTPVHSQKV